MPRELTVVEMLRMRQEPTTYFRTIDDYRSFAMSLADVQDVHFLCGFLNSNSPLVASRTLTAAFYFGGVLGIGDKVRKWLERDWYDAIDVYAPAVMRQAIADAGDITAIEALREAQRTYGNASAALALEEARATFAGRAPSWNEVIQGDAWRGVSYLLQQLTERIEPRQSPARIVWFLKHFKEQNVEREIAKYIGTPGIGVIALRVLICFMGRLDASAQLSTQPIETADEAVALGNVAYWVYKSSGDKSMLPLVQSWAHKEGRGRIANVLSFMENAE